MKLLIFVTVTVAITNVFGYHDPDLEYHLSRVQQIAPNCDKGYQYPAPSVQLSADIKPSRAYLPQLTTPLDFVSKIAYAQPATNYQTSSLTTNYESTSKESHGYATSAGLSSASSARPITPAVTYAQAPIIAKVTGSPLIAKYSLAPAKTTYTTQNLGAQSAYQTGSLAKASLNSFNTVHTGPVVSQVYAAPAAGYTVASALKAQAQPVASYSVATPGVQYIQSGNVGQYATSSVSQVSAAAGRAYFSPAQKVTQYTSVPQYSQAISYSPAVQQYSAPVVAQYSAPSVAQYAAPAAVTQYTTHTDSSQYVAPASVTQYSAQQYAAPAVFAQYSTPAIAQYAAPAIPAAVQYAAPAITKYAAPAAVQYSAPAVTQYSPAVATVSQYSAPTSVTQHLSAPALATLASPVAKVAATGLAVKNVHTDFLENYDAHPRYAFEYAVNDPHTGDIKQQKEERDGEVVKGQYSLVEPDGSVRTVNYVADWETGFHADVSNSKDKQH